MGTALSGVADGKRGSSGPAEFQGASGSALRKARAARRQALSGPGLNSRREEVWEAGVAA